MIFTEQDLIKKPIQRDAKIEKHLSEVFREIATQKYGYDISQLEPDEWKKVETWVARYRISTQTKDAPPEDESVHDKMYTKVTLPSCDGEIRFLQYQDKPKRIRAGSPPEKGLLFVGAPGRGKTALARIISAVLRLEFDTSRGYEESWAKNPYDDCLHGEKAIIIDDLGTESGLTHYGSESGIRPILLKLYDLWTVCGKLTIVTTNMSMLDGQQNSISEAFGERIASRFAEMFETVRFIGKDFRRQK